MVNLKDISVRTIVSYSLFFVFLYSLIPLYFHFTSQNILANKFFISVPFILLFQFIIIHLYITKYLVNPIHKVQAALKEIKTGNINTHVEYFGMNCAGKLIPDIKNMQENIVEIVYTISETANGITSDIITLKNENLELLNRTKDQVTSLKQTSQNMNTLYNLSSENEEKANTNFNLMEQNISIIKDSQNNSTSLTEVINNIKNQSHEISKISNIISGIAFQTNLLALNAAVEAAHAGEKGKGFAVVASEIRNLAANCAQYAKDIKSLISLSETYTNESVNLNSKNETYMNKISENILSSYESIKEISLSSKKQKDEIAYIEKSINSINQGTNLNFSLSEKTVKLSSNMNNSANLLTESISKFKLN